jgi:hypothetical protein
MHPCIVHMTRIGGCRRRWLAQSMTMMDSRRCWEGATRATSHGSGQNTTSIVVHSTRIGCRTRCSLGHCWINTRANCTNELRTLVAIETLSWLDDALGWAQRCHHTCIAASFQDVGTSGACAHINASDNLQQYAERERERRKELKHYIVDTAFTFRINTWK